MSGSRERLAAAQSALLHALLADGPAPAGFDPGRLRAQTRALRNKRRRVTAALRPDLPELLGERFRGLFEEYAAGHPRREGVGARKDADAFGDWLAEGGHLPRARPRWWQARLLRRTAPSR